MKAYAWIRALIVASVTRTCAMVTKATRLIWQAATRVTADEDAVSVASTITSKMSPQTAARVEMLLALGQIAVGVAFGVGSVALILDMALSKAAVPTSTFRIVTPIARMTSAVCVVVVVWSAVKALSRSMRWMLRTDGADGQVGKGGGR